MADTLKRGHVTEGPVFDFFERTVHPGYELRYGWHESWNPPFEFHYLSWYAVIDGKEYGMSFPVPLPASIDQLMVVAERAGQHAEQHWEIMQMPPEQREQLRQMVLAPGDEPVSTVIQTSPRSTYKKAIIIEPGEPTV